MVIKKENTIKVNKHGVDMWLYSGENFCPNAAVAYQETETGHAEEFLHAKSAFVFYIIEGSGVWIIEDREFPANAGDVVVVPAGKRFYYRGKLKQVCMTAPAWEEEFEEHIRDIDL